MVIILMAIDEYFIAGYCWLLMFIILMTIDEYFIAGYCWLLFVINGYW